MIHMSMITHGDKEKQLQLINALCRKINVPNSLSMSAREVKVEDVKDKL